MAASIADLERQGVQQLTIALVATKAAVTMGLKCAPLTGPNVKISRGSSTCNELFPTVSGNSLSII